MAQDKNNKELKIGDWVTFIGQSSKTRYVGTIYDFNENNSDVTSVTIFIYTGSKVRSNHDIPCTFNIYSSKSLELIDEPTAMLYILEG